MNILLMTNWGLGLEILKSLHINSFVNNIVVITRYNNNSKDKWENVVFFYSKDNLGYKTFDQDTLSLAL